MVTELIQRRPTSESAWRAAIPPDVMDTRQLQFLPDVLETIAEFE
jgi:hypothetical protein